MSESPLTSRQVADILEVELPEAEGLLAALQAQLEGRGLQVSAVAEGFRLCTRPEYAAVVARLFPPPRVHLSRPALETLAIIAYRQPITRPEIEAVRGVNVDGVIHRLEEIAMIQPLGHKQAPGRPMLYGTTREFLLHFGLSGIDDMPELPEGMELTAEALQSLAHEVDPVAPPGDPVETAPEGE
jgi:segregation and condensation protein B